MMMDSYLQIHSFITWISLSLTPLTVLACVAVAYLFYPAFKKHLGEWRDRQILTGTAFMILGIWIGFIGAFFDNFYWGIAWDRYFHESPSTDFWFNNGVFSNVIFRQTFTLVSATLHVIGAFLVAKGVTEETKVYNSRACKALNLIKVGVVASFMYAIYLWK